MIELYNQLISIKPRPIKSWIDGPWLLFNAITGFPESGSTTMISPVINKISNTHLLFSIAIVDQDTEIKAINDFFE
jgi:hypothetical protein